MVRFSKLHIAQLQKFEENGKITCILHSHFETPHKNLLEMRAIISAVPKALGGIILKHGEGIVHVPEVKQVLAG